MAAKRVSSKRRKKSGGSELPDWMCKTCEISGAKHELLAKPCLPGGLTEARQNLINAQARAVREWERLDIYGDDFADLAYALEELTNATTVLRDMMQRSEWGETFVD